MNDTVLLRKLIAIERSIGTASNDTVRKLIYEAENYLLDMQRERSETFRAQSLYPGTRRFNLSS